MQTITGYCASHIGPEFAVGRSRIHIRVTRPIPKRIHDSTGEIRVEFFCVSTGLTNNQFVAMDNVFAFVG